jgi:hypothetical protein
LIDNITIRANNFASIQGGLVLRKQRWIWLGYGEDQGINTSNEDQRRALKTLKDKQEA